MPLVKVASVTDLAPGRVIEAWVGDQPYALCNIAGEIHALEGSCPCTGYPLGRATIRNNLLVCPWHGWKFNCRTGQTTHSDDRVSTFAVTVQGDDILLDLPEE